MIWSIDIEIISIVFGIALLVYARDKGTQPTSANKAFSRALGTVIASIALNLFLCFVTCILKNVPHALLQFLIILGFLGTVLRTPMVLNYVLFLVCEDDDSLPAYLKISILPFLLLAAVTVSNPLTNWIFTLEASSVLFTEIALYLARTSIFIYIVLVFLVILRSRKKLQNQKLIVLLTFPIVFSLVLFFQLFHPTKLLSGFGAILSLLISYLYLHNKKMQMDEQTGLQNRKALSIRIEHNQKRKLEMDVLMIGIRDFKGFNARYGSDTGDLILQQIGHHLKQEFPKHNLFRYSGEKFIILLESLQEELQKNTVDNLVRQFKAPWTIGQVEYLIDANFCAVFIPQEMRLEEVLNFMEFAIDETKTNRENLLDFRDETILEKFHRRNLIAKILRAELAKNGFEVFYQPIFSIESQKFVSAEALLRLTSTELGVISPEEFIPIAEAEGLINDIGYLVLDRVCKYTKRLETQSIQLDDISVNFSALQMLDPNIVKRVPEIIRTNQVNPQRICIEITESSIYSDTERVMAVMSELTKGGIRFFLDDFGIAYSNISTVFSLHFDYVKIDRSLISFAKSSLSKRKMLEGFIRTFVDFGARVIIEGVENQEVLDLLKDSGAHYIQGFFYAKPMNEHEVLECLLAQENPLQ